MINFEFPMLLLLLIPLAALILLAPANGFVIFNSAQNNSPFPIKKRISLIRFLDLIAGTLFIILLCGPHQIEKRQKHSIAPQIFILLDNSGSMMGKLNGQSNETKLSFSKKVITELIKNRPDNLIGLITFAANSHLRATTTAHHSQLLNLLNTTTCNQTSTNTSLIYPLASATKRIIESKQKGILILITDGAQNKINRFTIEDVLDEIITNSIKVHTIGIGVDDQSAELLTKISTSTKGTYYDAKTYKQLKQAFSDVHEQLPESTKEILFVKQESIISKLIAVIIIVILMLRVLIGLFERKSR